MDLMPQKLESLEDLSFIECFIELPEKVRTKEYQTGLTPQDQVRKLISWGFNHGASFWLFKDSYGEIIIRLSARPCSHMPEHGTIGFFEMNTKNTESKFYLSQALKYVIEWLKTQGVSKIIAPVDLNTWFNYRFSVKSEKFFPRFSWEPTHPPEYLQLFKDLGFEDFAHYHSVFFPHFRIGNFCLGTRYMKKCHQTLHKQGFKLRAFDQDKFMTHEVPAFYEISHEAFAQALLFEPIDLPTFSQLYAASKQYDSSPSSVLISPDGEIAGFLFAFYDGDYLVIKSLAIRKKYQGLKLSSGLIYHAVRQSFAKNKKGTISALVKTGLASEKIENNSKPLWFSWAHDYVLVKKDIK